MDGFVTRFCRVCGIFSCSRLNTHRYVLLWHVWIRCWLSFHDECLESPNNIVVVGSKTVCLDDHTACRFLLLVRLKGMAKGIKKYLEVLIGTFVPVCCCSFVSAVLILQEILCHVALGHFCHGYRETSLLRQSPTSNVYGK